jgi:beta-xylosidase
VYSADFPDPTIVNAANGHYYAFSTNSIYGALDWPLVPSAVTSDLTTWTRGTPSDALARRPTWQVQTPLLEKNWAPAVHQFDATWVMYFVAPAYSGDQCIGVATSTTVQGPYQPVDTGPIVCDYGAGGSIDPSVILGAGNQPWLLWKTDGNCCQLPTPIKSQPLAADGLTVASGTTPNTLLTQDQAWEDGSNGGREPWKRLIEGPAMVAGGGAYWLFYSANWWDSSNYAVGYARCTSPAGPCVKPHNGPLLGSGASGAGPGGPDSFVDQTSQLWLVYHAWDPAAVGTAANGRRTMRLSRLDVSGAAPILAAGP